MIFNNIFRRPYRFYTALKRLLNNSGNIDERSITELKLLVARQLIQEIKRQGILKNIHEAEFQVFSQFGDDGIIQYLLQNIEIPADQEIFVEFGVQNYKESNTRFLLLNNNWKGLVMDASREYINSIKMEDIYWRHSFTALEAFINRDNINNLIESAGIKGDIGLLSIDIDGNDYWVWERINIIKPVIVIVEYNSLFGSGRAVTIPYDPDFIRTNAHYSNLYWGCSLKALTLLAKDKGYTLVGSNSAGNNAYFVRQDKLGPIPSPAVQEAYVRARFRESRDREGRLTFMSIDKGADLIRDMPLMDIENDKMITVNDIL